MREGRPPMRSSERGAKEVVRSGERGAKSLVRVTLDIPQRQHTRLKIAAIRKRVTLRAFMIQLLEREGIRATK
jgi:hypothetical protein